MKKFITYFLSFLILLNLSITPIYATHDPTCTDPDTLACKVCTDAYGDHHVDTIWTGTCATDGPTKVKFSCDHNLQINRVKELETTDPLCGSVPTVTPPPGSINIQTVFGKINPPPELNSFIQKGGNGAGGISLFLNNLIILIYIIAGVVFVFMLLWGALQWIMSGGDKEAVAGARNRIMHAIIGIVLFAVAFAVIKVIGIFTGFNFTARQSTQCPQRENYYPQKGKCMHVFYTGSQCTAIFEEANPSFCK